MQQPELPPGERYCPRCGAEMEVLDVRRTRVPGGGWQWNAELTCPSCGLHHGFGWAALRFSHHEPRSRLQRMLHLATGLWQARGQRLRPSTKRFRGPGRRLDLALLLAEVPFPVYGLRGHPLGLHLRGRGLGGGKDSIERIRLGYVTGDPLRPERAFHIEQGGPAYTEHRSQEMRDSEAVHHLIANYAPQDSDAPFRDMEEVNRDWNWNMLREAERRPVTLTVEGAPVEVLVASWQEPRLVNLASFERGGTHVTAASLGLTPDELVPVIESLVRLQGAPDVVAEHQRDAEAVRAQRMKEHDERYP